MIILDYLCLQTIIILRIMKKINALFAGVAMLMAGSVCTIASPDVKYFQPRDLIQVSSDEVSMKYDQTTDQVVVTAKSAYELYCRSSWLKVSQEGNLLKITTVGQNEEFVPRKARIILTTKKENVSRVITVTQMPEPGHDQYFALPKEGNILPMAKMDLSKATHDPYIKEVLVNKSVDGHQIRIKNNTYESAIATHAPSKFVVKLNGAMRFVADVAIDDDILSRTAHNHGNALYKVLLDGKEVAAGRITILDKKPAHLDINTHGAQKMEIILDPDGSNWGDHVDFGNPYFELTADKPELVEE